MTDEKKNEKAAGIKNDLNQLWKSTVDQFDEMKDLIVRSSGAGKARIDASLVKRQREKVVTDLGEAVLKAHAGGFPLPDDCAELLEQIEAYDTQIREHEEEADRLSTPPSPVEADAEDAEADPSEAAAADQNEGDGDASKEPPEVVDAKM